MLGNNESAIVIAGDERFECTNEMFYVLMKYAEDLAKSKEPQTSIVVTGSRVSKSAFGLIQHFYNLQYNHEMTYIQEKNSQAADIAFSDKTHRHPFGKFQKQNDKRNKRN